MSPLLELLVSIGVGFIGGVGAGLFGVGGGAIFVPALVLLLGEEQHGAQGVSLAVIVATATSGSIVNLRHRNVDLRAFAAVTPVAVVAVLIGAYLASVLPGDTLKRIFGAAVLLVGLRMLYTSLRPLPRESAKEHEDVPIRG
ncbi:MAG: sulfite exporter TauE/SafE family protein [Dehalococcoidia bacterium]